MKNSATFKFFLVFPLSLLFGTKPEALEIVKERTPQYTLSLFYYFYIYIS